MAKEISRETIDSSELFGSSEMYDDIERIQAQEEDIEKNENSKLVFAGMMALLAGAGVVATGLVGSVLSADLLELLSQLILPGVGFAGLGYGLYKTLKLVFRRKKLSFPSIVRKTKSSPKQKYKYKIDIDDDDDEREKEMRSRRRSKSRSMNYESARRSYRPKRRKRLARSRKDRVFAGVAGGLAEYLGVSSGLVRVGLLMGTFMTSGMLPFAYLLASIVLPQYYKDYERDDDDDDDDDRSRYYRGRRY